MEGTMTTADLDDIENMVADREVDDDVVEHLLSERLLDGFLLLERSCPACTTPLVKQPLNDASSSQPLTPNESKNAISIIQKMQSQDTPMSSPRQAPAPVPGVPFCVFCKAHVVTHESEIQHLDSDHNTMKHQGKILVDLVPQPTIEEDLQYEDTYETTTMSSTSTQFQPAALRQQNNNSCSPMSTRTSRSLLVMAGSSNLPTPTHANTNTHVKSAVVPPTLNEEKSVVPTPDGDGDETEEEIEVSITPEPTPMSSTPQLSFSDFLPVGLSASQDQDEHHENDSLIEIDDDDETVETFEVIHLSDDTDIVEGGPRLEYTIDRKTAEMTARSSKDSPPAQSTTHPSLTGEETNVASVHAAQIDMTLSNLEVENEAATVAEEIPHGLSESSSATLNCNETAGEQDNDLPEYSVRRDIATKVLAGKMMQGYSLTEQQCEKCSMPQVEHENKLECAVCPVLQKRALKSREKEQKHLELDAEKKRLANQKHKIELEIRLKRIADSEFKVEQEAEKQRLVKQELEQQRLIKLQEVQQQRLVERQAQAEKQQLAEQQAQAGKQQIAEQQAKAEKQQLAEQQAKAEKQQAQADKEKLAEQEIVKKAKIDERSVDQGSLKSQFGGVRTIRRTQRSTTTPMISVNPEVEVRTIRRTTPTPMVENHESVLQVAAQPFSMDPAAITPPSPTKVVELEAEEARLLAELKKAEEEMEFHAGNDVFRVKEAKINDAIMKGNQLLLQETRRLQELEKHQVEVMQMPAKGMLADLSAQELRKMREKEAVLRKEIEAAEQARDEATLEARRLADEKRAMEEARLLVALEEEATTSQNAAEKALENAKAARDHVASARRDIFAKTIADGVADAVAEAESMTRAEQEDYYEQVILPTASALRRESWETLRAEGRSVMTRRIMAGWTLLPEFCRGAECESSPLLCKHETKMCVVCGGDGSGTNGAYSLSDDDELDFDDDMTKDSTIRPPLEISTVGVIAPVIAEIEDTTGPLTSVSIGAFDTKRNMVCKSLIKKKMLEGWTLIDMACPHCVMPLMTTPEGIGEVCVLCGPVNLSNQDENPAEVSAEVSVSKETLALTNELQSNLDPQEKPSSLSSRIKQLDSQVQKSLVRNAQSPRINIGSPLVRQAQSPRIKQLGIHVESWLVKKAQSPRINFNVDTSPVNKAQSPRIKQWSVRKAQSPRIKQLGINVESSLVKKVQSVASKKLDKSVPSSSKLEQSGDNPGRKKRSVSSRIKQYLSAAVGKNDSTKEQSAANAEPEAGKRKFTPFRRAKSVPRAKLDVPEKSISAPSGVKQSNSSADGFVAKSEMSVKLDEQHHSVSSKVEQPESIAMMAQSVAMVAQLIVSDKQDGQQLNCTSERGAVSQVSATLDEQKTSKIKQYLNAVEELVEDQGKLQEKLSAEQGQEKLSSEKVAPDSTTEMPAAEMVKAAQEKSDSHSTGSEEEQSVAIDSIADFSKGDQSWSSSHATDDRYASLHATPSETSVKGASGRFEGEAAINEAAMAAATIAEEVDEDASPYHRPAHLFTTTKLPRTRGDPPALLGHTTSRRSNGLDPEDSRTSSGRLHSPQRRESYVEENKNRNAIEALPVASVEASSKQTPTDSPGDPPNSSVEISADGSHEEPATQALEKSRNGTEQMAKISAKQKQAPADSPGKPPKHSDSVEAEDSHSEPAKQTSEELRRNTEQMAAISISTEQTSKESRRDTKQIANLSISTGQAPKESLKEAPKVSAEVSTNEMPKESPTQSTATSVTQRKSNKLFDRIEFIKERREKILARKLQINASSDDSESERSSDPTIPRRSSSSAKEREPPLGIESIDFDSRDYGSSRRLSSSVTGRDAPPLSIDTGASVNRSVMHLPSPGMTEASFPKPFSSPGGASVRSSVTTPSGATSTPRPRITPEDFRPRSSSRQKGDSVCSSRAASSSRNEPSAASTESTSSPGLPRKVPRDLLPGKFRGHSRSEQSVQPEVIVIGGPIDKQTKRSSKNLTLPSGSNRDDASIGSTTLDALLHRIEETKAQLEETPSTTNRLEQQTRLKALIETLAAAADEVERKELDCLSE